MEYQDLIKKRRSMYDLEAKSPVSDEVIISRLQEVIKNAPTAFNSQATHIILTLGKYHTQVWDITKKTLKAIVTEAKFKKTEEKLNGFQAGYGTILIYKDLTKIDALKKAFPLFAPRQDDWGEQNIGILVYALWLGLTDLGLGVNIQHYDPLIDDETKKAFKPEESWKLETEMVFGTAKSEADEKAFLPIEERMKVFK